MNTSMDKLYTITSHIVESTWYVDIPKLEYELRWAPALSTSDPTSPRNGTMFYRSDTHKVRCYVNGGWADLN